MNPLKIITLFALISIGSPAYADFGCHFVVNSRLATVIDSSEKKLSFRFTCRKDMNLIALSLYCQDAQDPPAYQVGLREDEKGKPSSTLLEFSSVTPKAGGWVTLPLNELSLLGGKVYHLVVEPDVLRGGHHAVGAIGPRNFASFAYTDVLNAFYPNNESSDRKLNVLLFEKGRWEELNREPLFALHGSGRVLQGNPYDDIRARPIHGNGTPEDPSDDVLQGQVLHPHCGFYSTGFVIRVRKQGHPNAALNYRVYSHDYLRHKATLVFSGEALKPEQAPASFQWVTIGIPKATIANFPPECRYLVFQTASGRAASDKPGCDDCYLLSDVGSSGSLANAAELSFDGGAHLSRATYSTDGGANWIDEFERDANVILLGPDCTSILSTSEPAPRLIPTPLSILKTLSP